MRYTPRVRRLFVITCGFIGAFLGPVVTVGLAGHLLHDPLWTIGLMPWSAALNSLWPLGGGMVVDHTFRVRWLKKGLDPRR